MTRYTPPNRARFALSNGTNNVAIRQVLLQAVVYQTVFWDLEKFR